MQEISRSPPTVVFTIRLWQEPLTDEESEWRGTIKNLSTSEVQHFRQWAEIAVLVPRMLNATRE